MIRNRLFGGDFAGRAEWRDLLKWEIEFLGLFSGLLVVMVLWRCALGCRSTLFMQESREPGKATLIQTFSLEPVLKVSLFANRPYIDLCNTRLFNTVTAPKTTWLMPCHKTNTQYMTATVTTVTRSLEAKVSNSLRGTVISQYDIYYLFNTACAKNIIHK